MQFPPAMRQRSIRPGISVRLYIVLVCDLLIRGEKCSISFGSWYPRPYIRMPLGNITSPSKFKLRSLRSTVLRLCSARWARRGKWLHSREKLYLIAAYPHDPPILIVISAVFLGCTKEWISNGFCIFLKASLLPFPSPLPSYFLYIPPTLLQQLILRSPPSHSSWKRKLFCQK